MTLQEYLHLHAGAESLADLSAPYRLHMCRFDDGRDYLPETLEEAGREYNRRLFDGFTATGVAK
jgi:hypothetical protein